MTREYVENYLRINGISSTATDAEITLELKKFSWTDGDIVEALRALRGVVVAEHEESEASKVLYRDSRLSSGAVLSLLNIHIHTSTTRAHDEYQMAQNLEATFVHRLITFVTAIIVAGVTSTIAMFILKIGPFYL